jgi:hypothetical protein
LEHQIAGNVGSRGPQGNPGSTYGGTSTSSVAIGTGSKAFTIQAGLAYQAGARVRATSGAAYVEGIATSYDSGTGILTLNADRTAGSGTFAAWTVNVAGDPGSPLGQKQDYIFEATANQTTFSGADAKGNALAYIAGSIEVFLNGLALRYDSYTATNGTSIVFASGLNAGDVVSVLAYAAFNPADTLAKSANGGDVTDKPGFLGTIGGVSYGAAQTLTDAQRLQAIANLGIPFECGRLDFVDGAHIKFAPFKGDLIKINGKVYRIPTAGITSGLTGVFVNGTAGQNLAAGTVYYVYLFDNSGTPALDFSTTSHGVSGTAGSGNIGVETKNNDDTRSLIGMVFTNNTTAAFADLQTISWFNRKLKTKSVGIGNPSTTSSSNVQLGSTGLVACSWPGVPVCAMAEGQPVTTGSFAQFGVGQDAASSPFGMTQFVYSGQHPPACVGGWDIATNEGAHNYLVFGGTQGQGGTLEWDNITLTVSTFG